MNGYVNSGASTLEIDYIEESNGGIVTSVNWNAAHGGAVLSYKVVGTPLPAPKTLSVAWVTYPNAPVILDVITTVTIPTSTPVGEEFKVNITGDQLASFWEGVEGVEEIYLMANTESGDGSFIEEVYIKWSAFADSDSMSYSGHVFLRNLLRKSGQYEVQVSRTSVTSTSRAHAIFLTLTKKINGVLNLEANVAEARTEYASYVKPVIDIFEAHASGKAWETIIESMAIVKAMRDQIILDEQTSPLYYPYVNDEDSLNDVIGVDASAGFTDRTKGLFWSSMQTDEQISFAYRD